VPLQHIHRNKKCHFHFMQKYNFMHYWTSPTTCVPTMLFRNGTWSSQIREIKDTNWLTYMTSQWSRVWNGSWLQRHRGKCHRLQDH
jgi:hypothetical protein